MWKDSYAIGVDNLDNQHKELFEAVGRFVNAIKNMSGTRLAAETMNTLEFLHKYIAVHFADEEEHMAAHDYLHLEDHREMHRVFIQTVKSVENRIYDSAFSAASIQILSRFLVSWLENHVTGIDRGIVENASPDDAIEIQNHILQTTQRSLDDDR